MGDFGQCLEVQRLIELPVDALENPVHAAVILGAASGRRHVATVGDRWRDSRRLLDRVSLGVQNYLGATKQRDDLAGIPVSNDRVPDLRRFAEVHGLRAPDNRTFLGGT